MSLQDVDDYSRDYVERDERRLADLGRRAVEMFATFHIFTELQVASRAFVATCMGPDRITAGPAGTFLSSTTRSIYQVQ